MQSVMINSIVLLVRPYGFVGPIGHFSGMGIMSGCLDASPYTVADEENTMLGTLCFSMQRRRVMVPPTLTR